MNENKQYHYYNEIRLLKQEIVSKIDSYYKADTKHYNYADVWSLLSDQDCAYQIVIIAFLVLELGVKTYSDFIRNFSREISFLHRYGLDTKDVENEIVKKFWKLEFDFNDIIDKYRITKNKKKKSKQSWVPFHKYALKKMPWYVRLLNNYYFIWALLIFFEYIAINNCSYFIDFSFSDYVWGIVGLCQTCAPLGVLGQPDNRGFNFTCSLIATFIPFIACGLIIIFKDYIYYQNIFMMKKLLVHSLIFLFLIFPSVFTSNKLISK